MMADLDIFSFVIFFGYQFFVEKKFGLSYF